MVTGKRFQVYKGYTYGGEKQLRSTLRYRCTAGCGACLYIKSSKEIAEPLPVHNHPPPKLFLLRNGTYAKLKWFVTCLIDDKTEIGSQFDADSEGRVWKV